MTLIFIVLMVATLAVSLLLGRLAGMSARELLGQSAVMLGAALAFFGLVSLM